MAAIRAAGRRRALSALRAGSIHVQLLRISRAEDADARVQSARLDDLKSMI